MAGVPSAWLAHTLEQQGQPNPAFDLLHPESPFYQDASLAGGHTVSATHLLFDVPSGTNIAHFWHSRDGIAGLCLRCCAIGLVRWSCVASAGTKGPHEQMTAGLNGQTPAYVEAIEPTLLRSLLRAAAAYVPVDGDGPAWDRATTSSSPLGFLKGLTWQSRRVLLQLPSEGTGPRVASGRCCRCGAETGVPVTEVHFRPGWSRPGKDPWTDDPHLLRVTPVVEKAPKRSIRAITPSWPSPNVAVEQHAAIWRQVLEGLLQRAVGGMSTEGTFSTYLIAASQALYKHVGHHTTVLPEFRPDTARVLLDEMQWLQRYTWRTASGQTNNWDAPPRSSAIVEALYAKGAKGHAIRSQICAVSAACEQDLESAFIRFAHALAQSDQPHTAAIDRWRDEVIEIVWRHVQRAIAASVSGSALLRGEATQRAIEALRGAKTA